MRKRARAFFFAHCDLKISNNRDGIPKKSGRKDMFHVTNQLALKIFLKTFWAKSPLPVQLGTKPRPSEPSGNPDKTKPRLILWGLSHSNEKLYVGPRTPSGSHAPTGPAVLQSPAVRWPKPRGFHARGTHPELPQDR